MAAVFLVIFGGALAYALYGVVVGLGRAIDRATGRPPTGVKLPRGLHIAGQVTTFLTAGFVALLFWAVASGNFAMMG